MAISTTVTTTSYQYGWTDAEGTASATQEGDNVTSLGVTLSTGSSVVMNFGQLDLAAITFIKTVISDLETALTPAP